MENKKLPRLVALILVAVTVISGAAVGIQKLKGNEEEASSAQTESTSEETTSSSEENVSDTETSQNEESEEVRTFTLSDLYTNNLAGMLLEHFNSAQTHVTLTLPDNNQYSYTRYVQKKDNGDYYFHYLDDDGKEQTIAQNEIFLTSGDSIQFQVAYEDEYTGEILPYVLSTDPYYYEPTEEVRECYEKEGRLYLSTGIDMSQDDYYANNWGYTEGVADCEYILDSETLAIYSIRLSYNDQTMMETEVTFNGEDFDSDMLRQIRESDSAKSITVYYDYGSDDETTYHYTVPSIAAFYYSQPEGFTMYLDPEGTAKMSDAASDDERLIKDEVSLYLIQDKSE